MNHKPQGYGKIDGPWYVARFPVAKDVLMPEFETLIVFSIAALVMNLSPGPSNFYVMSRSVAQGPAAGAIAAGGLAAGSMVHVIAAAFGLSAIFLHAPIAFTALKIVGAAYLIYLGIRHLMALRGAPDALSRSTGKPYHRIFRESALVEILNPKTALFFLALLPQFVDPTVGPIAGQMLILGLIVTLSAIPCDLAVALAAGKTARLIARSRAFHRVNHAVSGLTLVGLGIFVALARRPAS